MGCLFAGIATRPLTIRYIITAFACMSLLKGRPFHVLDHCRMTTHTVVIAEYIASASTLKSFEFGARLLGTWVLNSRRVLWSRADVGCVTSGFYVVRAHTGIALKKGPNMLTQHKFGTKSSFKNK